tara:strand:- start:493 stop:1209 length:717 start_codon:yes stop_codon:yes gene_type:complete
MKLINKIVLGTMKLKKYFTNSKDLSKFLNYAHKKGVRQLHVSNEYDSYNLLIKSLKKTDIKKFTFILKLSEPKKDHLQFSLKKFKQKINKYRNDLGKKHTYIVQLVNRHKCNNPKEYLLYEQKVFDNIQSTIIKLKKTNIIKSFYFFPYYKNTNKIKKNRFINGITSYRNIHERQNDDYAKQNNYKVIAMRTFGGNNKILKQSNLKRLLMFNLNSRIVKKIIVGANNKTQLDQLLKAC